MRSSVAFFLGDVSILRTFVESFVTARIFTATPEHLMRTECDEWTPLQKELECLTVFAEGRFAELKAIVTIGYYDEV